MSSRSSCWHIFLRSTVQNGSPSEPQPEGSWRYAAVGGQVLRVDRRVVHTIPGRLANAGHGSKLTAPRRPMIDCWRKIAIVVNDPCPGLSRVRDSSLALLCL